MSARNRGRSTGRDVLPYKSACVWCTTINLNDLSPPRACFGIQEPQQGLLARQHRSSFGLLPFVEQLFSLEPAAEAERDCSTPITCPVLGAWLSPSPWEPTHHHSGAQTISPIRQPGWKQLCCKASRRGYIFSSMLHATLLVAGRRVGLAHF